MENIQVFYNVFDDNEIKRIHGRLNTPRWQFGLAGKPNTYRKFWCLELSNDPFFTSLLFEKVQTVVSAKCKLDRVFANGQTYGQDGDWHQDRGEKGNYTFVYYANLKWKPDWGGETDFLIDGKIYSVSPEYNKAVFFPGDVTHRGLAPTRECYDLRVSIAFQCTLLESLK